ncbi:MAG: alkaline phosphatase family protein [Cytophagaceae bacterium]|jgi:predicted AlkP superfamily pyrophosphatase or phosphodiesterase|nr:alkaline phosphatase family protein [Cytophagaceae bacterium]
MHKTVVLNVVGLSRNLLGPNTPFLSSWSERRQVQSIETVLPAVTCSVQATYLTGKLPEEHGIVGNGWLFKEEHEIKFWRQSNQLVQSPKLWEELKSLDPSFTCMNMFWWYNMYSTVDFSVTPRPQYRADGRKIPDVYTQPASLRDRLQAELGTFPLFEFWGPRTSIRSSQWIAKASMLADQWHHPTLTLIYLPHLDYNLQRYGTQHPSVAEDLRQIDAVCKELIEYYESEGAEIIVLSEYGITDVHQPIALNRLFRQKGWLAWREEEGKEYLDAGASKVVAVADHQVAHIYVQDSKLLNEVKALLSQTTGIEEVLDAEGKKKWGLQHERAGDLIAVADAHSWFSYYYWLEDDKAPDFARTVDIHRKPGYDPAEMLLDPAKPLMPVRVLWKLLKKKLGFRVLMDLIPLDATLVKGSHGRSPASDLDKAILISKQSKHQEIVPATEVYQYIKKACIGEV